MHKQHLHTKACALCALSLVVMGEVPAPANAQAVDYAALEGLFGEPVTTSVTGSPQRASEVPATMEIVTAREIRRSGARDLPGVLKQLVGIDVLQWGNDNADVGMRGYNQAASSRVLVLLDGRQVYADYYGFTPWSAIPVELAAIRQIEVVKGPNSALFGFNAVGGVINIVTHAANEEPHELLAASGGTQGLVQGSLVGTVPVGERIDLRIVAGGHRDDDFDTPLLAQDEGTRRGNERAAANLGATLRLNDTVQINLEGTSVSSEEFAFTAVQAALFQRLRTDSLKAELTAATSAGLLQARVYSNSIDTAYRSALLDAGLPPGVKVNFRNSVLVAQLQDSIKLGADHTLRIAAEYRHDAVNTTFIDGGRVLYDVSSASLMWQWALSPALTLTNAARFDALSLAREGFIPPDLGLSNADWSRSIDQLSFNSGLVWKASDTDTLRATVARGTQLPSLYTLGSGLFAFGIGIYSGGNPYVKPTVVTHQEISWDRLLPRIGGALRLSLFQDVTRDIVAAVGGPPVTATLVNSSTNVGDSRARGAELTLEGNSGERWRWELSYSNTRVSDHLRPGNSVVSTLTDYERTAARHAAKARIGWSEGRWELDAFARYQSRAAGVHSDGGGNNGQLLVIPAYVVLDARVAYDFSEHVGLAVSGQNLLHDRQMQTVGPEVERRVLGTVTVRF